MYARSVTPVSRSRRLIPWAIVSAVAAFAFLAGPSAVESTAGDTAGASLVTSRPAAVTAGVLGIRSNLDLRQARDPGPRVGIALQHAATSAWARLAAFDRVVPASPAGFDVVATALVAARAPPGSSIG